MESGSDFVYYCRCPPSATVKACNYCTMQSTDFIELTCGHVYCRICFRGHPSNPGSCLICGAAAQVTTQPSAPSKSVADTNVFQIKLSQLADAGPVATGDPVFCRNCQAILNSYSQVTSDDSGRLWVCEYCKYQNRVNIDPAEMPASDQMTYMLDPAPTLAPVVQAPGDDPTTAIFCIDTSGSMGTGVRVDVPISIKGAPPTASPSRLDCVKAAIEAQINQTLAQTPSRHIGIVEFESGVTVHGDGSHQEAVLANYQDFDALINSMASKHDLLVGRTVTQAKQDLLSKLFQLHPKGGTALGPGLLVSVGLATQGKPGSKVIICTDGQANEGIGKINLYNEEEKKNMEAFYEHVGLLAQHSGVSVSVISVADNDCKLSYLSTIADLTEGNVLKVNPENLATDFADILSERILATEVRAVVTMHKALKFKNENPQELQLDGSQLVRLVGNATLFSSFTFEYAVKTTEEQVTSEVDMTNITQLPFQLVIYYRNLAGQRCIKSFAKVLKVSESQSEAERSANFEVLHRNYQVQNSKKVAEGKFQAFKSQDAAYQELLQRQAQSEEQKQELQQVTEQMESLKAACGRQETEEMSRAIVLVEDQMPDEQLKSKRKEMMKDDVVTALNQLKKGKRS